jgi:hypothetical protein
MPISHVDGIRHVCIIVHPLYEVSLNPWSGVLLEKIKVTRLVKLLAEIYGTHSFLAGSIKFCHLSLS